MLLVGQFVLVKRLEEWEPLLYRRYIEEEEMAVEVVLNGPVFEAKVRPGVATYVQHKGKRIAASVYFEICAKYAEKVNGLIVQEATVDACIKDHKVPLAHYPDDPLLWQNVCVGFRSVLLGQNE